MAATQRQHLRQRQERQCWIARLLCRQTPAGHQTRTSLPGKIRSSAVGRAGPGVPRLDSGAAAKPRGMLALCVTAPACLPLCLLRCREGVKANMPLMGDREPLDALAAEYAQVGGWVGGAAGGVQRLQERVCQRTRARAAGSNAHAQCQLLS